MPGSDIRMDDAEKLSLEAIGRFVAGSEDIRSEVEDLRQLDVASGCPACLSIDGDGNLNRLCDACA